MAEIAQTTLMRFPMGIDNRSLETQLADGSLRVSVNLDIDKDGALRTRAGARLVSSGDFHSFFEHPSHSFSLVAKDGSLCRMAGDSFVVLRSLSTNARIDYAELNGAIFWSNGSDQGMVTSDGDADYWGILTPSAPACTAVATGGLRAGVIRVTQVAIAPSGFESGAPAPVSVDIPEGGGVQVTVPLGASFRVYATEPDGSEFRQVGGTWSSGSVLMIDRAPKGKLLESLLAVRPPAGRFVTTHKGRLWFAINNALWFTGALSPHWLFPKECTIQLPEAITMLGAVDDGLFVGTIHRVLFIPVDRPSNASIRMVLNRGVIDGSGLSMLPTSALSSQGAAGRSVAWMDTDGGLCVGRTGGIVQEVGRDRYVAGNATSAGMSYFERDGMMRIIAVLSNAEAPSAAEDSLVTSVFS